MVYLALAWRVFGFSPLVTRAAMILLAAGTASSLYALGRRVASREVAAWSALLLSVSPLFFAQSSLAHLDLPAALFTTLAALFLVERHWWRFALAATLAVLSKETAVVLLPVAWVVIWRVQRRGFKNQKSRSKKVLQEERPGGLESNNQDSRFQTEPLDELVQRRKFRIPDSGFRIQESRIKKQPQEERSGERGTQNSDSRFQIPDSGVPIQDSRFQKVQQEEQQIRRLYSAARRAANAAVAKWAGQAVPLLALTVWGVYYHHRTGYWTGNAEYLRYNLYSTLDAARFFWSLLRRLYELLIGGFNWLLAVGAVLGILGISRGALGSSDHTSEGMAASDEIGAGANRRDCNFVLLVAGLTVAYVVMLSLVGGAILPRYLLPIIPLFYLLTVALMARLPKALVRVLCCVAVCCFVGAWFINPPYPFPFEDNLAYADFVKLHQQSARYLEAQQGQPRILTAWPASDEITRPFLGYVQKPLRVVALSGLTPADFSNIQPESFDYVYLYSRKWEPRYNWLKVFPRFQKIQERHFDYAPQVDEEVLAARFKLKRVAQFERRGQWVRIYTKQGGS
jgi:dolichyl-phosphate-mannose-protein mannosyltransferase